MKKSTNLRHGRHCTFAMHVHLVFVTKYRKSVFTQKTILALKDIFHSLCAQFEAELIEFDGEVDHVHLLINYPPKIAISKLVNTLKGVSSRLLRKNHPEIASKYWKGMLWSPSYFAASCGGAPISIIKQISNSFLHYFWNGSKTYLFK
jgi:putative transposase